MTKEEQAKLQIDFSKIGADEQKYFDLFDKHIPENVQGNVLIYDISNLGCIYKILQKNPEAKYFIYGNESVNKGLKLMIGEFNVRFLDDTFDVYNINNNMKFDLVIMNPPYQKNLHLKILAEAIKHLKDDDSVCVNLSPIGWLQDPIAQYKKHSDYKRFEDNISKHIETLGVISAKDANDIFNIANFTDIGIYKTRNYQIKGFDYKKFNEFKFANCKSIRDKIYSYIFSDDAHACNYHLTTDENGVDYRVIILLITGQRGEQQLKRFYEFGCRKEIYKNGLDIFSNKKYVDFCGVIKKAKASQLNRPVSLGTTINFKTENEAKNFIKYSKLNLMTFCGIISKNDMHPQFKFLPFLGDAINPRTGLKGYEGEWTDEDLYKFFNITEDERKIIEETMAKYINKRPTVPDSNGSVHSV